MKSAVVADQGVLHGICGRTEVFEFGRQNFRRVCQSIGSSNSGRPGLDQEPEFEKVSHSGEVQNFGGGIPLIGGGHQQVVPLKETQSFPSFTIDTVSQEEIQLSVVGLDGFEMSGTNSVREISRSLEDLVAATWGGGGHHQYADGFALYTGTLFSPTQDRGVPGSGFTHTPGDHVVISAPHLGALENTTAPTEALEPWDFGIRDLMTYLVRSQ